MLKCMKVGWRRDSVETTGVMFIRKLTRVLWYLDTHHAKFNSVMITVTATVVTLSLDSDGFIFDTQHKRDACTYQA